MVNLKGQPYAKLSNAFLFRTKLDQSCKCSPHPWEKEAMDRHRKYAEDAAKKKLQRQAELDLAPTKTVKPTKSTKGANAAKLGASVGSKPERKALAPATFQTAARNGSGIQYATLNAATTDIPVQVIANASSSPDVTGVSALDSSAPRSKPKSGAQTRLKPNPGQTEQVPATRRTITSGANRMQLGVRATIASAPQQPTNQKRDWRAAAFAER